MTILPITKKQFEALRPVRASLIEFQTDNPHATETFYNEAGQQIAEAYYNTWQPAKFVRFDPPIRPPVFDEHGDQIVTDN